MNRLAQKDCVACKGGIPPLKGLLLDDLAKEVPGWSLVNEHHLLKSFKFADFASALAFVNRVGAMAEQQQHHPDIYLAWGTVEIKIWTHKIDGLTESDFVFAAKCDDLSKG